MFEVNQKVAIKLKSEATGNSIDMTGVVSGVFPERPYPVLVLADGIDREDEPAYQDSESGVQFDFSFTADGQLVQDADVGSIAAAE